MSANAILLAQGDDGALRYAEDLFRSAARKIRTRLINLASRDIPVRLGSSRLTTLREAVDTQANLSEGSAFARFKLTPGKLPGVMVIHGPLLNQLVGALLGAPSEVSAPGGGMGRPLTQMDIKMAHRISNEILRGTIEACILDNRPTAALESTSASPTLPFTLPDSSRVVEANFDFGPPEEPFGLMTIIVPVQAAGLLWPSPTTLRTSGTPSADAFDRILPVHVTATAELARMKSTLGALRGLKVGDTLDLGPLREVSVRVGGRTVLLGEAGNREGVRSIRVICKV